MKCPSCGSETPDGSQFCVVCGEPFNTETAPEEDVKCPSCDNETPGGSQFCGVCGEPFNTETALEEDVKCPSCGKGTPAGNEFCQICGARFKRKSILMIVSTTVLVIFLVLVGIGIVVGETSELAEEATVEARAQAKVMVEATVQAAPTITPPSTPVPTATATLEPTATPTPLPTATFTPMPPTPTPMPTPTPQVIIKEVVITATPTPLPTATLESPLLTEMYRHEMSGVSIAYPVNFEVMEQIHADAPDGVLPDIVFVGPEDAFVRVEIQRITNSDMTLEEFAADRIAGDRNFKEDSRVKIEFLPGYLSKGIGLDSANHVDILMVVNDPWVISVGFVSTFGLDEVYQPIFQAMIESFQISPPTTTRE